MKIKSVQIKNYGVHKDLQFDLEQDLGKLVFINGSNNHGKTSLLEALSFGLFGTEILGKKVSRAAIAEASQNAPCEVSVRIDLTMDSGEEARIYRSQFFSSNDGSNYFPKSEPKLRVTLVNPNLSEINDDLTGDSASDWLNEWVPVRFRDFIIFNGEKLEEFLSSGIQRAVEDSVRQVANIDYFDSVVDALKAIKRGLEGERAKLAKSDTAVSIQTQLNDAEDELESAESELKELQRRRDEADATRLKLKPDVESDEEAKKQNKRLEELSGEIKGQQERLVENQNELRRVLWSVSLGRYLIKEISPKLSDAIQKAHENREMPLNFQPEALESLLTAGQCICGRDVGASSDAAKHIEGHIRETSVKKVWGGELQSVSDSLKLQSLLNKSKNAELEKLREKRKELNRVLREKEKERDDTQQVIDQTPLSGFYQGASYTQAINDIQKLDEHLIPTASMRLETAKREHERASKAATNAFGKENASDLLNEKIEFLDRVLTQSSGFGDEILDAIKEQLEEYVTERFVSSDKGRYLTRIGDDFDLVTTNLDGSAAALSAGQSMLRAYFFSFALRSVVGMNIPLIVDSGIARLDGENKESMIRGLLEIFEGPFRNQQQAIFMMTDSEYTPKVAEIFESKFEPTVFYLEHHPSPPEFSKLQIGIDPEWTQFEFGPWFAETKKGSKKNG
jgi:DNA sulfur modification protein DndD